MFERGTAAKHLKKSGSAVERDWAARPLNTSSLAFEHDRAARPLNTSIWAAQPLNIMDLRERLGRWKWMSGSAAKYLELGLWTCLSGSAAKYFKLSGSAAKYHGSLWAAQPLKMDERLGR